MSIWREKWGAGVFINRAGRGGTNSFNAINCASNAAFAQVTVNSNFVGNAGIRGIATVLSGTTIVSVSAAAAVSGAAILTGIIQYASVVLSQAGVATAAESVRAGAFEIRCVGSRAPVGDMPVAWFVVR